MSVSLTCRTSPCAQRVSARSTTRCSSADHKPLVALPKRTVQTLLAMPVVLGLSGQAALAEPQGLKGPNVEGLTQPKIERKIEAGKERLKPLGDAVANFVGGSQDTYNSNVEEFRSNTNDSLRTAGSELQKNVFGQEKKNPDELARYSLRKGESYNSGGQGSTVLDTDGGYAEKDAANSSESFAKLAK